MCYLNRLLSACANEGRGGKGVLLSFDKAAKVLGLRKAVLLAVIDAGELPAKRDESERLQVRFEDAVAYGYRLTLRTTRREPAVCAWQSWLEPTDLSSRLIQCLHAARGGVVTDQYIAFAVWGRNVSVSTLRSAICRARTHSGVSITRRSIGYYISPLNDKLVDDFLHIKGGAIVK